MSQASVIVVGNEKGGAGKSTLAIHIVTALLHGGAKVAVLDLDLRQQTLGHFFANRKAWLAANERRSADADRASDQLGRRCAGQGARRRSSWPASRRPSRAVGRRGRLRADRHPRRRHRRSARAAHAQGRPDRHADERQLRRLRHAGRRRSRSPWICKRHSLYSETVWACRKQRATVERKQIDWVVLRNRLAPTEARNRRRLDERVEALSKKVGFRVGPGPARPGDLSRAVPVRPDRGRPVADDPARRP